MMFTNVLNSKGDNFNVKQLQDTDKNKPSFKNKRSASTDKNKPSFKNKRSDSIFTDDQWTLKNRFQNILLLKDL